MKAQIKSKLNLEQRVALEEVIPLETPFLLYVDPSSACNFRCQFCPTGHKDLLKASNYKRSVMDFGLFEKLIDDLAAFPDPVKVMRMNKIGEPLLNKKLASMIALAKASGRVQYVDLATNAALFSPALLARLVASGLDRINISLEGINSDQYRQNAKVDINFENLVGNIRWLFANRGDCEVTIKIPANYVDEAQRVEFYETFGDYCDRIFIEELAPIWPDFDVEKRAGVVIHDMRGQYQQKPDEKLVCTYIFYAMAVNSDGTYPQAHFDSNPFDWEDIESNNMWEEIQTTTLYDEYSHELESRDINGNYQSVLMSPDKTQVTASTINSKYSEAVYSGVEYSFGNTIDEGNVDRGTGAASASRSHTGNYSLLVNNGQTGFTFTLDNESVDVAKAYRASVWLYVPGDGETQKELNKVGIRYTANGVIKTASPVLQKNKSKNWYLVNLDIDPNGHDAVIECFNNTPRGTYFDDFRVHPIDAGMTTYVYDPKTREMSFALDGNNIYTHFEYDGMGKLVRTTREQMNFDFGPNAESFKADHIMGEAKYNYGKNN